MHLQRSEPLRELYECLLEGEESDQQANMPSAALSPDDLSDAEWYYLVCMSFVFNPGQGLPGKALASDQAIWLCNAHSADSKVFSRSLLAKSASIQTVICFPYLGGVLELGVTELVLEDPSIIQHIKTSLLEFSKPVCSEKSSSAPYHRDDDADIMYAKVDHEMINTIPLESFYSRTEDLRVDQEGLHELGKNIQDDYIMGSPGDCSNGCDHNHHTEDSFLLENINGGTSQMDDFSNCVQVSMNSSNCISQVAVNQENATSPPKGDKHMNKNKLKELQEGNDRNFGSLGNGTDDDLHYKRTLSAVLMRNFYPSLDNLCFQSRDCKSSFASWKKGEIKNGHRTEEQQQMLKKILFDVPLMHGFLLKPGKGNGGKCWLLKQESDEMCVQGDGIENEMFLVLKSMVPSVNKVDKATILGYTIEYLKELERRVGELESCFDLSEHEAKGKYPDVVEQVSENNENRRIGNSKEAWINKRKACDIEETEPELSTVIPKDGSLFNVKVRIKEQEVLVEMRCPSRDYLLIDIIEAMNNLNIDAHSVQSSTIDGVLTVTIQSKFRGTAVSSARMIKQALSTIAGKC